MILDQFRAKPEPNPGESAKENLLEAAATPSHSLDPDPSRVRQVRDTTHLDQPPSHINRFDNGLPSIDIEDPALRSLMARSPHRVANLLEEHDECIVSMETDRWILHGVRIDPSICEIRVELVHYWNRDVSYRLSAPIQGCW